MRTAVLLASLVLFIQTAFAEEVVLKIRTVDADSPLGAVKTKDMQFESTGKPDGAKVPKGDLAWGKLTLGQHSYMLCIIKKKNKLTKLYLDNDGDKDFKEETPVEAKYRGKTPYFIVDGVKGEFKVGDDSVSGKIRVWVVPAARGYVYLMTGLFGEIEAQGKKFTVTWVPGKQPLFRLAAWKTGVSEIYIGKKKITLDGKSIAVKDGKATMQYKVVNGKEMAEVKTPEGLSTVELYHKRTAIACIPSEGKLYLPKGSYSVAWGSFDKENGGSRYSLNVLLGTRNFSVKEGMTIQPAEPLKLALTVQQKNGQVSIGIALNDAFKRKIAIFKDDKQVADPKLKVTDSEGNIVATYQYKPG